MAKNLIGLDTGTINKVEAIKGYHMKSKNKKDNNIDVRLNFSLGGIVKLSSSAPEELTPHSKGKRIDESLNGITKTKPVESNKSDNNAKPSEHGE